MNAYDDELDPVERARREHDVDEKNESDMGDETEGGKGEQEGEDAD
jgi:hypothetical protein